VKVLSISRLCVDPTTRPRPVVAALLLAVAVVDPVIDYDEVVGVGHERRKGKGVRGDGGWAEVEGGWVVCGLRLGWRCSMPVCWVSMRSPMVRRGSGGEGFAVFRRMADICRYLGL
jgi:hypothetical protein